LDRDGAFEQADFELGRRGATTAEEGVEAQGGATEEERSTVETRGHGYKRGRGLV